MIIMSQANSYQSQSLFLNSPEYLEKYQIGLTNEALEFNLTAFDPNFFKDQVKFNLNTDQDCKLYVYKRIVSELIVFQPYVRLNLVKLAMSTAVSGNNPRLLLSVDTEGKLGLILENDITRVIKEQFNDTVLLLQLLNQNILKTSIVFN